jgi:hypothetical protein
LQTYTGHDKEITCVRFSPDGRWVASSSKDGQLHIWDIVAGKNLQSFKSGPSTHVTTFEFNPLALMLAAVTSSRTVRLWDLETMQLMSSTPPDSSHVKAICFTNDEKTFCSATKDTLKLWNWDPSVKLVGSADVTWDRVVELKATSENSVIGGAFMSNFVSVWNVSLDDLPAPMSKSSASAPIPISSSDAKQSGRLSGRFDQKLAPQASSPGERSPGVRGQWGSNNIATNLPPSPSRISNSSPISKKSQDLFAKALSQGKSSPEKPSLNASPEILPPALQLPSSSSSSSSRSNSRTDARANIPRPDSRQDKLDDIDNYIIKDIKSSDQLSPSEPKSSEKLSFRFPDSKSSAAEALSPVRADLRPRCLDIIEGLENLDIASFDDDIAPPSSSPPQVKWESEHAAIEMATSLGESFWKRFQESRTAANAAANMKSPSGRDAPIAVDNNQGIAYPRSTADAKVNESNTDKLRHLLPGSRYPIDTNEDKVESKGSPSELPVAQSSKSPSSAESMTRSPSAAYAAVRQQVDVLLGSSAIFTTSLSQRLTSLRVLRRLWEKGDIDSIIDHLTSLLETVDDFTANTTISPTAVNAAANAATSPIVQQSLEFFENIDFHRGSSTVANGQRITNLTFDHAIAFMRILNSTLRIRSPGDVTRVSKLVISYQMEVVLVKVIQLYELFGDILRQMKAIASGSGGAGVDLVREERLRKYKLIDSSLNKIKAKVEMFTTALSGGSSTTNIPGVSSKVNDLLARFHQLVR